MFGGSCSWLRGNRLKLWGFGSCAKKPPWLRYRLIDVRSRIWLPRASSNQSRFTNKNGSQVLLLILLATIFQSQPIQSMYLDPRKTLSSSTICQDCIQRGCWHMIEGRTVRAQGLQPQQACIIWWLMQDFAGYVPEDLWMWMASNLILLDWQMTKLTMTHCIWHMYVKQPLSTTLLDVTSVTTMSDAG